MPSFPSHSKLDTIDLASIKPPSTEKFSNVCSTVASSTPSFVEVEKGVTLKKEHDLDDDEPVEERLPDKIHGRILRQLRHHLLNIYRRLFGVVFIVNMSIFIATLARGGYNASHLGLIVVANIFVAVLMRQEHVVNALFFIFCSVPPSYALYCLVTSYSDNLNRWPLIVRTTAARIYSLGGGKTIPIRSRSG